MPRSRRPSIDTFADTNFAQWLKAITGTVLVCMVIAGQTTMMNQENYLTNLRVSLGFGLSIVVCMNLAHWLFAQRTEAFNNILGLVAGITLGMVHLLWLGYGFPLDLKGFELWRVLLMNLALALVFCLTVYYLFYSRYRIRWLNHRMLEQQSLAQAAERELALSRLQMLQSQIEPHFLFNTLANVQGLIDQNPDAAKRMIGELTTMLRVSLSRTRQSRTRLSEELALAEAYLSIQALRTGGRLQFQVAHNEAWERYSLPPLLVQPLVENAVVHGLEPKTEGGRVDVRVTEHEQQLLIEVVDDGLGLHQALPSRGQGVGLHNVRERLALLYGESASLVVDQRAEGGTRAALSIPVESSEVVA
ncbi:hypothetical protein BGP77_10430 [Saccharospirillum sp. MSK14-1]|uniref:sensor histidine kinase n=1 Tax=Saccharospirillum sp. MSK14-1 TaxID=1897632 RepID=UPI000D376BA4|nr:histidine kinase [Saccharospirillum sp. MSK14-1]PTY38594.1 hypothetical protein BGP77_10430 [Saccharospirillum sp. MSK14-1]